MFKRCGVFLEVLADSVMFWNALLGDVVEIQELVVYVLHEYLVRVNNVRHCRHTNMLGQLCLV